MQINSISSAQQSRRSTPNFKGGVHVLPSARKTISEHLPDFYLGSKSLDSIYAKLEGTQIDMLKYLGLKPNAQTKVLNNIDVNIHNVYVNPANGEKSYLYSIPQLGSGYYMIGSKKSVLENPVSLYKDVVARFHRAEIANRFNLIKELYKAH